jgi:hypothetical protein
VCGRTAWRGRGGPGVGGGGPAPTGTAPPWGGAARRGPCTIRLQNGSEIFGFHKNDHKTRVALRFDHNMWIVFEHLP